MNSKTLVFDASQAPTQGTVFLEDEKPPSSVNTALKPSETWFVENYERLVNNKGLAVLDPATKLALGKEVARFKGQGEKCEVAFTTGCISIALSLILMLAEFSLSGFFLVAGVSLMVFSGIRGLYVEDVAQKINESVKTKNLLSPSQDQELFTLLHDTSTKHNLHPRVKDIFLDISQRVQNGQVSAEFAKGVVYSVKELQTSYMAEKTRQRLVEQLEG